MCVCVCVCMCGYISSIVSCSQMMKIERMLEVSTLSVTLWVGARGSRGSAVRKRPKTPYAVHNNFNVEFVSLTNDMKCANE